MTRGRVTRPRSTKFTIRLRLDLDHRHLVCRVRTPLCRNLVLIVSLLWLDITLKAIIIQTDRMEPKGYSETDITKPLNYSAYRSLIKH